MKNITILLIVASLGIFSAGYSWALPIYGDDPTTEPTLADWSTNPPLPTDTGYYIWSDSAQQNWSLRWTGNNDGGSADFGPWHGMITIADTQTLLAAETVQFEVNDLGMSVLGDRTITWSAFAGPKFDGIDFSVSGPSGAVMLFQLGATGNAVFDGLVPSPGEVLARNVFVGKSFITPLVEVVSINGRTYQQLGMDPVGAIPEPGTIFLLGAGLCGLAALGRRRAS